MDRDIVKGKALQSKGKLKEEFGKATGDISMEIEGAAEQMAGQMQEGYGKVKRSIKEATGA